MAIDDGLHRTVREVIRNDRAEESPTKRKLWALIVGISEYKDKRVSNLEFAHADANALYAHLTDPRCGGYLPSQIRRLTNADATRDAIWKGLRTFLKQPAREDFVVVFFACHGGPDPDRPDNLYVFPHDTNLDEIEATAIPMDYVKDALNARNLLAERVVLLADACHSGGLQSRQSSHRPRGAADAMNRFIQNMARSRPGMATLTAAEEGQVAWEGPEWGGGHGVFTHYLLEGLRGGAARPEDGVVTIGQLFDYVRDKVIAATSPERPQHPSPTVNADTRQWPMAVVSDLFADERYQLGRALSAVGQRLGDEARLAAAIDEHTVAIELSQQVGRALPAARYEIARCCLAMGDFSRALTELAGAAEEVRSETAAARDVPNTLIADVAFWTWAAALQSRDHAATEGAAARFFEDHGADPRAVLVATMSRLRALRRHALLIGVDLGSRGPSNDVAAMRQLLLESGYSEIDIVVLDSAATTTRHAILDRLEAFRLLVAGDDETLVYFAGKSVRCATSEGPSRQSVIICTSDFDEKRPESGIQPKELDLALSGLPSQNVLFVIDSCYGGGLFDESSSSSGYALLSGTNSFQEGGEHTINGVVRGVFSEAFVSAVRNLAASRRNAPDIAAVVDRAIPYAQTPWFWGDKNVAALRNLQDAAGVLAALRYTQREYFGRCSGEDLKRLADGLSPAIWHALPSLREALGRACLDKRMYDLGTTIFEPSEHLAAGGISACLGHAVCLSHLGHYDGVQRAVEGCAAVLEQSGLDACRAAVASLQRGKVARALLVGISRTSPYESDANQAVVNDVRGVKQALLQAHGQIDIEEIVDEQATRSFVLERFGHLVAKCREVPCLFFFAGRGNPEGEPTLLTFQSRGYRTDESGITLRELAEIAGPAIGNLVCVIDAGWVSPTRMPWSAVNRSRCESPKWWKSTPISDWVAPNSSHRAPKASSMIAYRDLEVPVDHDFIHRRKVRADAVAHLGIGGITIYNSSLLMRICPEGAEPGEYVTEAELPSPWEHEDVPHGVLTHTIFTSLIETPLQRKSYKEMQTSIAGRMQWLQPVFIGTFIDERFMSNMLLEDEFERTLRKLSLDKPVFDAIALLSARLDRLETMEDGSRKRELYRAALRELGIARLCAGDIPGAIEALQRALDDGGLEDPDVRGYLGRALVEQGDDLDGAVSHLQEAIRLSSPEAPAHMEYYYGRALRERMENRRRDDLVRLEKAWRNYLNRGAQLGHRSEIEVFLAKSGPSR